MSNHASISLGEHFERLINEQIQSGKFASVSEVVRAALRLFEQEEDKKKNLISALKEGEKSGFQDGLDETAFLKSVRKKHLGQ